MKNKTPKLSVIIPVFNTAKYLERCFHSIANQTYQNLEIILVDDGSNDNSPELCDKLAKTDERAKVVHKQNGGVSSARNAGLKVATGELVAFVDSDDYLLEDYYEKSVNLFNDDCDIVVAGIKIIYDNNDEKTTSPQNNENHEVLSTIDNFMQFLIDGYFDTPVNKIFKRSLINFEFLQNQPLGEDRIFNLDYFKNIKNKIVTINNAGYIYEFNTESACHKTRENMFEILEVPLTKLKDFLLFKFGTCNHHIFYQLIELTFISAYNSTAKQKKNTVKQKIVNHEFYKHYVNNYKPNSLKHKIKKMLIKFKLFNLLKFLTK